MVETPIVSLFKGHQLQPENDFSYIERAVSSGSFGFFILFICAGIILYLQRNSDGIFSAIVKASFDSNQANQDARVENAQRSRNLLIIQIVSSISIALLELGLKYQSKPRMFARGKQNIILELKNGRSNIAEGLKS